MILHKRMVVFAAILAMLNIGNVAANTYPIQFSIPEVKVVEQIPVKDRDFASLIPGQLKTYIYDTEEDYYRGYQRSYFAVTTKKGGWDCMRHYEILANGCIPYFIDIDKTAETLMPFLPKELIKEAMSLEGVSYLKIDHSKFNKVRYYEILAEMLEHTRRYLTTRSMALYLLEVINYQGSGKILFLSQNASPDYLRETTLIGLKELLGERLIDYPKIPFLYKSYEKNIRALYGKGMTYTRILDDLPVDRTNIEQRIRNKEFDFIIYGSVHRGLPFHDLVCRIYTPDEIVYICGEDDQGCNYRHGPFKHFFLREFLN